MCICSNFNIISGYGGQIVFGFMLFVGAGGYTSVLLFKFLGVTPWVGMLLGAMVAALLALFIGYPTLRLRGHFFAMATMAFPLMTIPIINQLGFEEVHIPLRVVVLSPCSSLMCAAFSSSLRFFSSFS